ncbi:WD repeat-containing protein 48-like [Chenopodium quinoa]|nr:WD repeat-containing protein 48-like [Chenopodium quinoa]XP_021773068.1 WD repeat-containing protein 48-like [Chenopodium quinoa]
MHRVGSAGNTSGSNRPRKEKRLTYVLNASDDTKHSAGVNCLAVLKSNGSCRSEHLFTGSRDGTLKRWAIDEEAGQAATCSATFESHVDWVNDAVLVGDHTLVSCSSDTALKTWNCMSNGVCTKTLRQHSDYVTCLAAAGKNSNIVSSGGLGGEVFVWDIEAALAPVSKSNDGTEEEASNGISGGASNLPITSLRTINSSNSLHSTPNHGYIPTAAKGHKESVYALAMNDSGTILVSGGTEKVVRVWDPRSGSKTMKLRGHTDNVRALLLDSTGRYCLSGSSDSMIRLWDLGQQRCVHSYAVHTDSVWALASTASFSHVYSGGRDQSLYLTDLSNRESILLCSEDYPILQLALDDESIWVASTDSSVHRWPAEGHNPQKMFQRGGSFLAGNLSFSRARASLEGSTPIPVYREPTLKVPGVPAIVQHEILNNRRHVLTKDTSGSVKLWEITRGTVIEDYGEVSFDEKKKELFEMVSIPAWFTVDTRLGSLSIHLDTPQCFSAEMYSADLQIAGKPEDDKVNLARETLKGLLAHWLAKRKQRLGSQSSANGEVQSVKDISARSMTHSRIEVDGSAENDSMIYPPFEFSAVYPPSIITEGSQGGVWRKKITDLDGTEDEKDLPWWVMDCVLNNRLPPRENTKCSFYLHPYEGSTIQILTQGKLSAPRILRIHKVINYVVEKMVLDKSMEGGVTGDATFAPAGGPLQHSTNVVDGSLRSGLRPWQRIKPAIEILCNDQVLSPEMSLATVRAYVWKKSDDLVLNYRVMQGR